MGKENLKKYQHYVPQVYLRNFTYDGEHIHTYYLERKKSEPKLIEDVAGENYFYDQKLSELKSFVKEFNLEIDLKSITQKQLSGNQTLENFFSKQIEGELFKAIQVVIDYYKLFEVDYGKTIFEDFDKYLWSLYAMYQFFRTKTYRDDLAHSMKIGNDQVITILQQYQKFYKIDLSKEIEDVKKSSHKYSNRNLQHKQLADNNHMRGMANIHFGIYFWYIGVASETREFVTSDNPCAFAARYRDFSAELYFPISPKLCFILVPKRNNYSKNYADKSFIKLDNTIVDYINRITIENSDMIVLSKKEIDIPLYLEQIKYRQSTINKTLFLNPIGQCYIAKVDLKQKMPEGIIFALKNNGYYQVGSETIFDAPLIFVSKNTKSFRLGYIGNLYGKPIDNRIYSDEELMMLLGL